MRSKQNSPLKSMLHPYVFFLREGGEINKDFLDYSLMMVYVHAREKISSPSKPVLTVFDTKLEA